MSELSLADIAAAAKNDDLGGGNSFVLILLFAMIFGWGGNGFGNNNGNDALQRAVDLNSIQRSQEETRADVQRGIYEINGATKDAAYNNLGEIRDVQSAAAAGFANVQNVLTAMQANQQNCCCTTQRAIDSVNYNLATESAAIQANNTANTQKILDRLCSDRQSDMQAEINSLRLQKEMAGVIRFPDAWTYSAGQSPFCGCSGNL